MYLCAFLCNYVHHLCNKTTGILKVFGDLVKKKKRASVSSLGEIIVKIAKLASLTE